MSPEKRPEKLLICMWTTIKLHKHVYVCSLISEIYLCAIVFLSLQGIETISYHFS